MRFEFINENIIEQENNRPLAGRTVYVFLYVIQGRSCRLSTTYEKKEKFCFCFFIASFLQDISYRHPVNTL